MVDNDTEVPSSGSRRNVISCLLVFSVMYLTLLSRWRLIDMAPSLSSRFLDKMLSIDEIGLFFHPLTRTPICKNSKQGRDLICDSRGHVCSRHDVNQTDQCCSPLVSVTVNNGGEYNQNSPTKRIHKDTSKNVVEAVKPYDCTQCLPENNCCQEYEYCISCCLKPQNLQRNFAHYLSIPVLQSKKDIDYFDYCGYVCRTSSLSVQNENSYRGNHNHCFSQKKSPIEKLPINSDWSSFPHKNDWIACVAFSLSAKLLEFGSFRSWNTFTPMNPGGSSSP